MRYNQSPIYLEHKMNREFDAAMKSGDRKKIELAGKGVEYEKKCYRVAFLIAAPALLLIALGLGWIVVNLVQTFGILALIFNPVTFFFCLIVGLGNM